MVKDESSKILHLDPKRLGKVSPIQLIHVCSLLFLTIQAWGYAHIEIVVAFLVVTIFSCLIIASYGVGVMTWEFGEMFSYGSSTFLYLLEANIQARDLSCLPPLFQGQHQARDLREIELFEGLYWWRRAMTKKEDKGVWVPLTPHFFAEDFV